MANLHHNPFELNLPSSVPESTVSPLWWDEYYKNSGIPRVAPRNPVPEDGSLPRSVTFTPPSVRPMPNAMTLSKDVTTYNHVATGDLTGTILGVPQGVFKVREVTKLLMFAGLAAGTILLLDVSSRFLVSMSQRNK